MVRRGLSSVIPFRVLVVVALLGAASLAGCSEGGSSSGTCNPRCTTGCCSNGQCVFGNQQTACGANGMTCLACPGGTTCNNGQCVSSSTCGPGTCAGCCSGGQCLQFTQQSSSICGTNGNQCTSCSGQACTSGICGGSSGNCNSTNCAGCCSPTGQCLQFGQQTASQCGSNGNACASCPGGVCQNGTCVGGSCNASTCAGCCTGTQCLQFAQQSTSLCGKQGQACRSCGGAACTNGDCQGGSGNCPNCTAGCCQNNVCIFYASQGPTACGTNGAFCQQCPAPSLCQNGSCGGTGTCSPTTCVGCCQGNTCLSYAQQTSAACGMSGQVCTQCNAATPTCSSGQCQGCNAVSCGDGCCQGNTCLKKDVQQSTAACGLGGNACISCPVGQACVSGQCMIAWRVIGVSAKVKAKSDPDTWDGFSTTGPQPDPMLSCRVQASGKTGQTKSVDDNYTPVWNTELFTESQQNLQAGLACQVLEDDFFSTELMGDCPVLPNATHFNNPTFTLTVTTGCSSYVDEVTVQFVKK